MENKKVVYNSENSEFTLLVYFKSGYTKGMKFHSGKQEYRVFSGYKVKDLRYALNRLVSLVEERFKQDYKTAIIYHNPTNTMLMQYAYGLMKSKAVFSWQYIANGDVLVKVEQEPTLDPLKLQQGLFNQHAAMKFRV